jgi:hypothetical protein
VTHGLTGLCLALAGLSAGLAFGQYIRRFPISGPIAATCGILAIPTFIAAVWRIAQSLGWWTILIFIVVSLLVGTINGFVMMGAMRSPSEAGFRRMQGLQTVAGVTSVGATIAAWFF